MIIFPLKIISIICLCCAYFWINMHSNLISHSHSKTRERSSPKLGSDFEPVFQHENHGVSFFEWSRASNYNPFVWFTSHWIGLHVEWVFPWGSNSSGLPTIFSQLLQIWPSPEIPRNLRVQLLHKLDENQNAYSAPISRSFKSWNTSIRGLTISANSVIDRKTDGIWEKKLVSVGQDGCPMFMFGSH